MAMGEHTGRVEGGDHRRRKGEPERTCAGSVPENKGIEGTTLRAQNMEGFGKRRRKKKKEVG